MARILVTGASGNIGTRIVRRLIERGQSVRVFVRNGEKVRFDPKVEVVTGDLMDPASVRQAVQGTNRIYLLSVGPNLPRHDANVIEQAASAGVEHIVKHSVAGAQFEASAIPRWHRAGEKLLEQSRLGWTLLRLGSFASNALGWIGSVKAQGKVYGALGDAALAVVDPEDIADVAAHVLTTPGHAGKAYDVTGPESLTTAQQVAILGEVIGKKLEYINVPDEAARKAMVDSGMPEVAADAMVALIQDLRRIGRVPPTDTVRTLLGRPPHSFRQWAEANAAAFR